MEESERTFLWTMVHGYANMHQVCLGMLTGAQASWPGTAYHGVNNLSWPLKQCEHIQTACWE